MRIERLQFLEQGCRVFAVGDTAARAVQESQCGALSALALTYVGLCDSSLREVPTVFKPSAEMGKCPASDGLRTADASSPPHQHYRHHHHRHQHRHRHQHPRHNHLCQRATVRERLKQHPWSDWVVCGLFYRVTQEGSMLLHRKSPKS